MAHNKFAKLSAAVFHQNSTVSLPGEENSLSSS